MHYRNHLKRDRKTVATRHQPLGMDKTAERLEPARLNQALIRLVHRGPTVSDIFPKLNNV